MPTPLDISESLALAFRLADAAGAAALPHFRTDGLVAHNKEDGGGFDPVTQADRLAERAIREILARERPQDGVFGEEEGRSSGQSGHTWVIDPIDGTRAFISGLPTWGVLIALDDGAEGRIGIIDQPYTGERFAGTVTGGDRRAALYRNGTEWPIRVRPCPGLAAATLFTTDPALFAQEELPFYREVEAQAKLSRYGVDCYAYALLALGQIDLIVEAGLAAYDIAGPAALVRGAGGVITDWHGGDCRWGGRAMAAGDPRVHTAALRILSQIGD